MAKRKKQEQASLRERLCHTLDIQPEVFPRESFIEIRGRSCITVKGGDRVLTYTDSEIRISLCKGAVRILGKRLCCTAYHQGAAVVDGYITSVEFEEEL